MLRGKLLGDGSGHSRFLIGVVTFVVSVVGVTGDLAVLSAQEPITETAFVHSISGYGMRKFVRNRWGAVQLNAINPTDQDRELFVTLFDATRQSDQYGKRIWVPAQGRITTWLPFFAHAGTMEFAQTDGVNSANQPDSSTPGITIAPIYEQPLDIRAWVTDIHEGIETPVPRPTGENFLDATIPIAIRERRSAFIHDYEYFGPENRNMVYEAFVAMRISTRNSRQLSELVPGQLPVDPLVLGSFDNLLIASDDIFRQTGFIEALQGWLLKGGQLWLMLDRVSPEVAQQILGNAAVIEMVDDTSLTSFTLQSLHDSAQPQTERFFEEPVTLRRVIQEGGDVEMEIDGWPALFWVPYGRGKIMVSTLEARGWVRRFGKEDVTPGMEARRIVSRFQRDVYQNDFSLIEAMKPVADKFVEEPMSPQPPAEVARKFAADRIGYTIPSRGLIGSVLLTFCVVLGGSGWLLMRTDRAGWMILLSPLLAIICGGILYGVGAANRQNVPETLSQLQFVQVVSGSPLIDVDSTGTIYVNSSQQRTLESTNGDLAHLTRSEASNEYRRMIWSDERAWEMDNVVLPAGQSFMTQPAVEMLEHPARVRATLDANGVSGQIDIPGLTKPTDGVLVFERGFAEVKFDGQGGFRIDAADRMVAGQFIGRDVLDDDQRIHQEFFRDMFMRQGDWQVTQPTLYFWDQPRSIPLKIPDLEHFVGAALYAAPVVFDSPLPNTPVTIPQALVRIRSGSDPEGRFASTVYSWRSGEWMENRSNSVVYLRFQVPESLRPIQLQNVKLSFELRAEDRAVQLASVVDGELKIRRQLQSPRERITVDISDPAELKLNPLHEWVFAIDIQKLGDQEEVPTWLIQDLQITMSGIANQREP